MASDLRRSALEAARKVIETAFKDWPTPEILAQIDAALAAPDPADLTEAEAVERLTAAMREAATGGASPRHVRTFLLPAIAKHGLRLVRRDP